MRGAAALAWLICAVAGAGDAPGAWDGAGSQLHFMERDECIIASMDDAIVGRASKRAAHTFSAGAPRGLLHRAFSVFLFQDGKMLLQKRAADKITFPGVWTNTCCSHQLYGTTSTEVDGAGEIASGAVPGAKRAALRKLHHEFGIKPETLRPDGFKFLTRLHYWGADVATHGSAAPWGEHEIDYILFYYVRSGEALELEPAASEIADLRWVSRAGLAAMLADPEIKWSPWFRIIADRFLPAWWDDDLDETLDSLEKHADYKTIHRFDPAPEHQGGAGNAGPWLDDLWSEL
ncbi:NUDIX hydrolase domain-like protein [Pelagophyceae sp. CCMP2097]|nr:NUDIX hydrolase domain-like protein [Pelagophyceae sp. CCMP2097]